ncbi:MAG: hypothetical protein U5Q44_10180 [Dehalococcoidia bacterium]|nr:hypothetical protein [Dehalococcoidia bacterium]
MSHIDAAKALIRAIDYDTFSQIETAHHPLCTFHSFRGPILQDALAIADWHRIFARNYADLTYTESEYIEQDDTVAVRATLEAKGYDWRRFHQRAVDVMEFDEYELVTGRRLYAMLRDIEFEKQVENAFKFASEAKGGKQAKTEEIVRNYYTAILSGDDETARGLLNEKCAHIDPIYGVAAGADAMVEIPASVPEAGVWLLARHPRHSWQRRCPR